MGNRIPIDNNDMLDYLIEGIPDRSLCNQARIHCFATKESLIDAFDKITLREQSSVNSSKKNETSHKRSARGGENAGDVKGEANSDKGKIDRKSCFNCGLAGHVSAACPTKELGPKCFHCNEHGHIATKCQKKKNETMKEACTVMYNLRKKYMKTVTILHNDIDALIDTGSDMTLMRKDEYEKIGSPPLRPTEVRFTGISSPAHTALGEFQTEIAIDGHCFPILVCVVADAIFQPKLLIGTDFLEPRNFRAKKGTIYIDPDDREDLPEILQISMLDEEDTIKADLSHIEDQDAKKQITTWIENYRPNKTVETIVSMRLVLKDNEVVYQKARRLAANERDIVNAQIEEWKSQDIVQPSSSDYASPVVLVKKKDGSYRLCVDYRLLNKKIIRD